MKWCYKFLFSYQMRAGNMDKTLYDKLVPMMPRGWMVVLAKEFGVNRSTVRRILQGAADKYGVRKRALDMFDQEMELKERIKKTLV